MLPFPELVRTALEAKNRVLLTRLQSILLPAIERRRVQFRRKSDSEIRQIVQALNRHLAVGEKPKEVDVNLMAAIAEASRRTVQLDPFEPQILAALLLTRNKVIQMNTGEGKTLVAPFAAISAVLRGMRVLVVTANPYLSSRDAEWMHPIYDFFGIACGAVDPDMSATDRYDAYDKSVVYVPGGQLILDYLSKHNAISRARDYPIPRSLAILDEIDNVLIDQGNKKFVLGDSFSFHTEAFAWARRAAEEFCEREDFEVHFDTKDLTLTDRGRALLREISNDSNILQPLQAEFFLRSALKARILYRRNVDYLIEEGCVLLVNSVTGLPEPNSKLSFGLQQAIEEKEGVPHSNPLLTLNETTAQGFYRGFAHLCGMSGSAVHNALEFKIFYKLDVVPIPPHLPCRREDLTDTVYRTRPEQLRATTAEVREVIDKGRPVLVGTLSVEEADAVGRAFQEAGISHQLLTARNYREEAEIIERAGEARQVTVAAKLAGRGVDIKLTDESRRAGGLHVIGFGRARERRLDEQLAGRSGRQGDPGSAHFILSLEDDLMHFFAEKWVSNLLKNLGMDEDVPIESKLIGRRIFVAQRQLTLMSFSSRNWFMILDECTRDVRVALFDQRDLIASAYQLRGDIDQLFERYAKRVLHGASDIEQAISRTETMAADLGIPVSADLYTSSDLNVMSQALKCMLSEQYELRRAKAGDEAPLRERGLHLRTIDSVWAEFLVNLRNKTGKLSLGDAAGYSNWSQLADLLPFFSGQAQRLLEEADRKLVRNLFKIEDSMTMSAFEAWGAYEAPTSDDRLQASLRAVEQEYETHPEKIKPEASLAEYLDAYREDIQCNDSAAAKEDKVLAILAGFRAFLEKRSFPPEAAFEAVRAYRRGRFMSLRRRRLEKDVLEAFVGYLIRQGLAPEPKEAFSSLALVRRGHLVSSRLAEPLMLMKWIILVLSLIAYPKIVSAPFAATCSNLTSHLPRAGFVPPVVEQFYDEAYLGGSWARVTLGLIGVTPILLMGLFFRLLRPQFTAPRPLLAIPLAFVMCAGLTFAMLWGNRFLPAISPWCTLKVFGAMVVATAVILLIVDLVQIVELVGGINFVVIINLSILLFHKALLLWQQLPIRWWAVGLGTLIAPLLWLSDRRAAMNVNVATTGSIEGRSSELEIRPTNLRLTTIFDNQHLIVGFLAAALIEWSFQRVQSTSILLKVVLPVVSFGLAAFATLLMAVRSRLSTNNIEEFLDSHNAALNGGNSAMSLLQSQLIGRCTTNATIRTALFALLMVSAGLLDRQTSPDAYSGHALYVAVIVMMWSYLAMAVIRQTRFLFTGYSSTLDITIPEPKPTEEEDLTLRQRLWSRAVKIGGGGPIQLIVFVSAFLEALRLFWEIGEWCYRHALTTYHHFLPTIHHH